MMQAFSDVQYYNSMDRQIPVFNKLIMNKIHQDNMQKHYKNLISIRKSKKLKPSTTNVLNKNNSKSMQLQEERKTEIDKNNVMLFQKMDRILKRDDPYNKTISHRSNSKRMNQEQQRIYEENRKLVDRLAHLKPTIDNKKFCQERKKQLNILKFIGKHSPNNFNHLQGYLLRCRESQRIDRSQENENRQRIKTENFKSEEEESTFKFIQNWNMNLNLRPKYNRQKNVFKRDRNEQNLKKHIHSSLTNYEEQPNHQRSRILTEHTQPDNRSINLFKTIKRIEESSYCISIMRTHDHYEISLEQISEDGQYYRLQLEEAKGKQLFESIDYDYDYLVDKLYIENGELAIEQDFTGYRPDCQRELNRVTPQAKIRKVSQMFLPSHITEQNEEEVSMHQQTTVLKNSGEEMEKEGSLEERGKGRQSSPIRETFHSFGNNHEIEDY